MQTCQLSIPNALGLHARAAAKFVHTAGSFTAHIRVARGDREVDGKSIMGLLLLAAAQGSAIRDLRRRPRRGRGDRGAVRAGRARLRRVTGERTQGGNA